MRSGSHVACLATALLLSAWGCDPNGPPPVSTSLEETQVKGVVKVRGKPVNNGTVTFHSANIGRATKDVTVPINKDGTFEGKSVVGVNTVIVDCRELNLPRNRELQESAEMPYDFKSGVNEIEINFPREP